MAPATSVLAADPDGVAVGRLRRTLSGSGFRVCGVAVTTEGASALAHRAAPGAAVASARLQGGLCRLVHHLVDELGLPTIVLAPPRHQASTGHAFDVLPAVRAGAAACVEEDSADLAGVLARVVDGEAVLSGHHLALVLEELRAVELVAELRRRGQAVRLTEREWDVVELLRRGWSTAQIAVELGIAPVTVRTHVSGILHRAHAASRDEALAVLLPGRR